MKVITSYEMYLNKSKTFVEYLIGMKDFDKPIDDLITFHT